MSGNTINKTGFDKVKAWKAARASATHAEQRLQQAVENKKDAEQALVAFLTPADAQVGETFAIWCSDGDVQYGITVKVEAVNPLVGSLQERR